MGYFSGADRVVDKSLVLGGSNHGQVPALLLNSHMTFLSY